MPSLVSQIVKVIVTAAEDIRSVGVRSRTWRTRRSAGHAYRVGRSRPELGNLRHLSERVLFRDLSRQLVGFAASVRRSALSGFRPRSNIEVGLHLDCMGEVQGISLCSLGTGRLARHSVIEFADKLPTGIAGHAGFSRPHRDVGGLFQIRNRM